MKCRRLGAERSLSFGAFPIVTRAEARVKQDEAKRRGLEGVDPGVRETLNRQVARVMQLASAIPFSVLVCPPPRAAKAPRRTC